jgi:hypothetical protein
MTATEDNMAVELNHTIIWAKDKWASARFLAHNLGVEAGPQWAWFVPVRVGGVTLDFADSPERHHQHYAFLVGEEEFDAAFARIRRGADRSSPPNAELDATAKGGATLDGRLWRLFPTGSPASPPVRGAIGLGKGCQMPGLWHVRCRHLTVRPAGPTIWRGPSQPIPDERERSAPAARTRGERKAGRPHACPSSSPR